jgi:C-methyltransferase
LEIGQLTAMAWFSKAVAVSARLGVADLVGDGSMSHADIAAKLDCDPAAVRRLMQVLALVGVYTLDPDGRYRLTAMAQPLRSDHPESKRHFCMLAGETYYDVFGGLLHTVRTGEPASPLVLGGSIYEHLDANPEAGRVYDRAMAELAAPISAALVEQHDFTRVRSVVDVGGGNGAMLKGILARQAGLTGVCADRADVCVRAERELRESADAQLTGRLSFQPIDFFQAVPPGADRYLLKNVLHNWSPDSGERILATIADALRHTAAQRGPDEPEPRLLVIEPLIDTEQDGWRALFQMVVCAPGTRGLSTGDLLGMLQRTGLVVRSTQRLGTEHTLVECAADGAGAAQPDPGAAQERRAG